MFCISLLYIFARYFFNVVTHIALVNVAIGTVHGGLVAGRSVSNIL